MKEKKKRFYRSVDEKWDTSDYDTIKLWGVVYTDVDGFIVPFNENNFKPDKESLQNAVEQILENNNHERLVDLYGKNVLTTLEIRQVECHANGMFIQVCNYPFWQHWERYVEKCAEETK